jgi:hypothetical protein
MMPWIFSIFLVSSLTFGGNEPAKHWRIQCNSTGWGRPDLSFLSTPLETSEGRSEKISVQYLKPTAELEAVELPANEITHQLTNIVGLEPPKRMGEGLLAATFEIFSANLVVKRKDGLPFFSRTNGTKKTDVTELKKWVICGKHTYDLK